MFGRSLSFAAKDLTENLSISQYYKISTAKSNASNIVGGLQDNGGFAYSNGTWHEYHGGDGMDCVVDPNDENIYYRKNFRDFITHAALIHTKE